MAGIQMNMRVSKRWRSKALRIAKRRGVTWSELVRWLVIEEEMRMKQLDRELR